MKNEIGVININQDDITCLDYALTENDKKKISYKGTEDTNQCSLLLTNALCLHKDLVNSDFCIGNSNYLVKFEGDFLTIVNYWKIFIYLCSYLNLKNYLNNNLIQLIWIF